MSTSVARQFIDKYGPKAGENGPLRFVIEVLGAKPDNWQRDVLLAYGRGMRGISIAACHGPGKTCCAAWIIVYQMVCRFPQNSVATAPSSGQLFDALFKEVSIWFGKLPPALNQLYNIKSDRIEYIPAPKRSWFSARTARAETPEALAGVHCEGGFVLLIVDEAAGVPAQIYASAIGSMSGSNVTTLLLGNPTRTSGFFYDSHHRMRHRWYTVKVSYKMSTRVDLEFVEFIREQYGEESNQFKIRCLGEFPITDVNTCIPPELVAAAQKRDILIPPNTGVVWGLDVARGGANKTSLCERSRLACNWIEIWDYADTMQTTGRVVRKYKDTPDHARPTEILVDVIGWGAGVVDRMRELNLPVRGVNVSETASASDRYRNLRTELWFTARDWLAARDSKLPTGKHQKDPASVLAYQLSLPTYDFTSTGKMLLESKEDMKARGEESPDAADSFINTFAGDPATLIHGARGSVSWRQVLKRGLKGIV